MPSHDDNSAQTAPQPATAPTLSGLSCSWVTRYFKHTLGGGQGQLGLHGRAERTRLRGEQPPSP